jgi:hypothetical protein
MLLVGANREAVEMNAKRDEPIQPNDRNHPGHGDLIRARVDELVRHISRGKCDPAHPGKRAKTWWAKAYGRMVNMQSNAEWWKENQPKQYAIIHLEGGEPLNYRELDVAYAFIPKHKINVKKVLADLTARIESAALSAEDLKRISDHLGSDRELVADILSELYRNYTRLKRIASGNLEGHGTEYSSASKFDPSIREMSAEYDLDPATISALRKALYVLVREDKFEERNPVRALKTIGISAARRPRRGRTNVRSVFSHGRSKEMLMRRIKEDMDKEQAKRGQ